MQLKQVFGDFILCKQEKVRGVINQKNHAF